MLTNINTMYSIHLARRAFLSESRLMQILGYASLQIDLNCLCFGTFQTVSARSDTFSCTDYEPFQELCITKLHIL